MINLETVKRNIVRMLSPLLQQGWILSGGGKFRYRFAVLKEFNINTPWRSFNQSFDCKVFESRVLHELIYHRQAIPLRCLACWKIVCHPRTYMELRAVEEYQARSPWESKCGMETRDHVPFAWGAYWYCADEKDGRHKLGILREWLVRTLGHDADIKLKRGCTEFEYRVGPSTTWKSFVGQEEVEEYVRSVVEVVPWIGDPPEMMVHEIHQKWIEHAHAIGDMSYVEETGRPLFGELVGYGEGEDDE